MIVFKEYYGADRDGNRGVFTTFVELELSDKELVQYKLLEHYPECCYEPDEFPFPSEVTICVYDDDGRHYECIIDPSDWVDEEFFAELQGE